MRRRRRALLALPLGDADDDDDLDDDDDDDADDERDDREAVLLIGARRGRPSADPRDYASTLARHVAAVVARLLGATAPALTAGDAAIVERVIADATAGLATADAASVRAILALPVDERREAVKRLVRAVTYELEGGATRTVNAPSVTDMIAQTLVHDAANQIMLGRYEDAGVTRVRWCVDGAPCPVCAADDGLVRRLGDPFPSTGVDAPPAHPNCCPPGTMIATERGSVAIERVTVGDRVLTHRGRFRAVTALVRSLSPGALVELTVGAIVLRLTAEHPVLTPTGWRPAGSLRTGDPTTCAFAATGRGIVYDAAVRCAAHVPFEGEVYNFAVAEDESYVAEGVVVHNCACALLPVTGSGP